MLLPDLLFGQALPFLGLHSLARHGVVFERFDGAGHGAYFVLTIAVGNFGAEVVVGQPLHHLGEFGQRGDDFAAGNPQCQQDRQDHADGIRHQGGGDGDVRLAGQGIRGFTHLAIDEIRQVVLADEDRLQETFAVGLQRLAGL